MNAQVQWLTPSPLWAELSGAQDLTAYRRPAILRFATDTFIPELQAVLQTAPQSLRNYVAQGETWQNPASGLGNPTSLALKLFQPVHARFYVIASSLICRKPGLPDHDIDTNLGESAVFVVRQLRPIAGVPAGNPAVYDPTKFSEYAWITTPGINDAPGSVGDQPEWAAASGPNLVSGEAQFPLAPSQTGSNGSTRRTLTGLIPASRREQYINGRTVGNGSASGNSSASTPQDPRADLFNREVITPWCLLDGWWNQLDSASQADSNYQESAQQSSALILADFASLLSQWIPNVWGAIQDNSKAASLSMAETALYNALGAALRQAILNANQFDPQFESAGPGAAFPPPGYSAYSLSDPGNIDPTTLLTLLTAALPPLSTVTDPPSPQPVPQKPSDPLGSYWFIVRCVYLRPQCGCNIISAPSQPFQLASYFDSDAPARRIQVALPVDTSAAALRKFDKGISFLMSDELRNQMARVPTLQDLSNGQIGAAGTASLGWICSFSIPIITICAMILLFVIVFALNIVFFWLPFFRICLPVPGLKAKSS